MLLHTMKLNQSIQIGNATVKLIKAGGTRCKIGVDAPEGVRVTREQGSERIIGPDGKDIRYIIGGH